MTDKVENPPARSLPVELRHEARQMAESVIEAFARTLSQKDKGRE
jgi:hypothetical protein